MKNKGIVDAQGNPIGKTEDRIEDLNLPPGVQALVETRINDGVDRLREHNQAHLNALAADHAKKWRILALISWVITIVFAIWAPIQIPRWIKQYVEDHMTKPRMEKIADEAIRTKMGAYVDEKLRSVERSAGAALANVSTLTNQVAAVSTDLAMARSDFENMSGDILALRQFFNARRGDKEAYFGLLASAQKADSDLASALLRDIQEFYRDFKNETQGKQPGRWGRSIIHVKTLDYFKTAAESIHLQLTHPDPYQRRAEVNETARRGLKYFVEDLVTVATNDPNVLVSSRAVSCIEHLAGKSFGDIPPFQDVVDWWRSTGHTNETFTSPFSLLAEADAFRQQRHFDKALALYQQVTTNRSGLAHAHYYMGLIHKAKGDTAKASSAFKKATDEAQAFEQAVFEYASLLVQEGKNAEAVAELKKLKPYFMGDFAETVTRHPGFAPLRDREDFKGLFEGGE